MNHSLLLVISMLRRAGRWSASSLLLGMMFSTSASFAAGWTIPVAGNSFQQAPEPGRLSVNRQSAVVLSGRETVLSTYFHVDRAAELSLLIEATPLPGESASGGAASGESAGSGSELATRVGGRVFTSPLRSDTQEAQSIGRVSTTAPGYVRVDFSLAKPNADTGLQKLSLKNLIVRSESESLQLNFVGSNQGNMFYWGRRGPSVHLSYVVPRDRDLRYAYSELTVPVGQDPIGSYFMANGFGEGYFGIQVNGPEERRVLFSVWSPFRTDNPDEIPEEQRIVTVAQGEGVRIGQFGNEGSGGQSFLVYPWKAGQTYRFLTEVQPDGGDKTRYTCWFGQAERDGQPGWWRLIASFRRPNTDTYLRRFHSFLENFSPATGHIGRRVRYRNVWVRDTEDEWHECTQARFTVDATGGGRHRLDFTGGATDDAFFLRNCGFFDETGKPGETLTRASSGTQPPSIDFDSLPRT